MNLHLLESLSNITALQSELFRFNLHALSLKIPKFNLLIVYNHDRIMIEPSLTVWTNE